METSTQKGEDAIHDALKDIRNGTCSFRKAELKYVWKRSLSYVHFYYYKLIITLLYLVYPLTCYMCHVLSTATARKIPLLSNLVL